MLLAARRLHRALAGEVLRHAEIRWGDLDATPLQGATTLEVVSVGKHLLHRVDRGVTLHTHLRMEGRWRTSPTARVTAAQRRSPKLRVLLATGQHAALGWQLGMVDLVPTAHEHRVVGHLGPDLLSPGLDEDLAIANLAAQPDRLLAEALLDQRNVAGLGTIFASEPLFLERLNPWTAVGELSQEQLRGVVRRARRLLRQSVASGRPVSTGDSREPAYVFARRGLPCRRCGGMVRMATVGEPPQQRVLCYCPTCQGGLAAHDDGRPQGRLGPTTTKLRG